MKRSQHLQRSNAKSKITEEGLVKCPPLFEISYLT
jgi:hypothetical protein